MATASLQPSFHVDEPHVAVAGECVGGDALDVTAETEIVAHVAVGQEFELVAHYRYEPGMDERDFYRVALVSRIGETTPPVKLFQMLDKKSIRSVQEGTLTHRYAFRAPGVYEGTFAIRGEQIAQARRSTDVVHWKAATREGRVRVVVGEIPATDGPVVI